MDLQHHLRPAPSVNESVAGEEDPGAALDAHGVQRGNGPGIRPQDDQEALSAKPFAGDRNPGDEADAGTPGTGEDICRTCGGTGQIDAGICAACGGSGKVVVGVGGG
jgi:DnaJ-class molecular chaperone